MNSGHAQLYDSYVICTSPRSGSTLLCHMLGATGVAGKPASLFHEPSIASWLSYYGLEGLPGEDVAQLLRRIFVAAIAKGKGDTGTFGMRLQRHSFQFFVEQLAVIHPALPSDRKRFEAAFGRTLFVYLTRRDKVAQAVSCLKAEQTGLWHRAPDGTEIERNAPAAAPAYDGPSLRKLYDEFATLDAQWPIWFAAEGIDPLRISYDELSSDPLQTLRQVLSALGVDPDASRNVVPGVAKLSDETNAEWAARFRAENDLA